MLSGSTSRNQDTLLSEISPQSKSSKSNISDETLHEIEYLAINMRETLCLDKRSFILGLRDIAEQDISYLEIKVL